MNAFGVVLGIYCHVLLCKIENKRLKNPADT